MRKALRIASDTHNLDDYLDLVRKGEMQIWHNEKAVILTEIVDAPNKRYINGVLSAGELDAVLDLMEKVQVWGRKEMGAEFGRAMFRPGYEKFLKDRGWKKTMVVMEYHPKGD